MTAMSTSNKDLAAKGVSLLEETVLLVLLQARREGKYLGGTDIAKMLEIPYKTGDGAHNNAIVSGVLAVLKRKKKAEQTDFQHGDDGEIINRTGWQLTDAEFRARQRGK